MALDVNQAPPYGSFDGINYIARPYEIVFDIDKQKFASEEMFPLELKVFALVDGQKEKTEIFNQQISPDSAIAIDQPATDEETDLPATGEFEEIQELADLPEDIEFFNISRFSIVSDEAEKSRAWPEEVFWSKDGSLWVIDSQRRKLLNFSVDGALKFAFGEKGKDEGQMGLPVALTVKEGKIFIADRSRKSLHKFSEDGTFLLSISSDPLRGFKINLPVSLCFRGEELWVADRVLNRVHCFTSEGRYLGGFGKEVDALINAPIGIRADSEGLFILEDTGIIKKFTPMGKQIAAFQTGCSEPRGFDVDPWGGIWVCDAGKFQVVRFDQKGRVINVLNAPPGPRPWMPAGVDVRQDGKIAVADAENKQVHIFSVEN
jgi:sugar lactone lactonase YvrE